MVFVEVMQSFTDIKRYIDLKDKDGEEKPMPYSSYLK